jgi:hypothetical protein
MFEKEITHWDDQLQAIHQQRLEQIEQLQKLISG